MKIIQDDVNMENKGFCSKRKLKRGLKKMSVVITAQKIITLTDTLKKVVKYLFIILILH